MGGSGSGKTSLLNIIAQRVNQTCVVDGEVRCNGRLVEKNEFGKFGSYV